ncbi:MAG: glycosyltransferase family 2 protein [Acidobacteria bacterium]|nr:glycosyltransferase family 2 protein [Acidobacteriota bacterium]
MPVTFGIPFFNAQRTLRDAIGAVFAQTNEDWELILVDDGSVDGSLETARAVNDPRVRVLSDGANRGLPARLNQIVAEARFEVVARMDADDLMSPHRLDRQLAVLEGTGAEIVTSAMAMLSDDLQPTGIRDCRPRVDAKALLRGHGIAHAPLIARARWFRHNRYDESLLRAQDAELWCRSFHAGTLTATTVAGVDEPLYFCREEAGVSLSKVLKAHAALRRLVRAYGPGALGRWGTRSELARSFLRSGTLRCLAVLGLLPWATSRVRNRRIADSALAARIRTEVAVVRATKVPGLDG